MVDGLAAEPPRDANGNSLRGRAVVIDSSNVLVRSEEQLVAVVDLKMRLS
jgi:mannose-1-phosphate guanylyltransferase